MAEAEATGAGAKVAGERSFIGKPSREQERVRPDQRSLLPAGPDPSQLPSPSSRQGQSPEWGETASAGSSPKDQSAVPAECREVQLFPLKFCPATMYRALPFRTGRPQQSTDGSTSACPAGLSSGGKTVMRGRPACDSRLASARSAGIILLGCPSPIRCAVETGKLIFDVRAIDLAMATQAAIALT